MIAIKFLIIRFAICLIGLNANAQFKEKQIELLHLTIENKNLSFIIDSIVSHEKKCSYYDSKMIFDVSIKKSENNYFLIIESLKDSNIVLSLNPYGYFYHQNHLFFLNGDNCEDLFLSCCEKKIFKYLEYDSTHTETDKEHKLYAFTDDSFSQWQYWYVNKKIIFGGKSSFCK